MRFTRLKLTGFKSFVDPTELLIQDGLTGVVGPNGCGKSNLLEALRWVMGENRPTAMRGGGMEDVIFAGAATRPARNFAEVSLTLDNSERLAPSGFNDSDVLDIVRRITREVGSAYKVLGKDVRARDVQMLFADASTGAHSPALVRQGQISELINAKPKNRRRILEEAAGISGLYQRRHEAELKLRSAEANLLRVDDVIEQLSNQLAQLMRQAKQAARYREIGESLRHAEGLLLFQRWQEADRARLSAEQQLKERILAASQSEAEVRMSTKAREAAEDAMPPLREEEAVASAILQRLNVQRDSLNEQEAQAKERIQTLENRIEQLLQDLERETGLNKDAGETIERLEWEARELAKATEGQDEKLASAQAAAQDAAGVLQDREAELSEKTEDVARLAARHQSAQRLFEDMKKTVERSEASAVAARQSAEEAEEKLSHVAQLLDEAKTRSETAVAAAAQSEQALATIEQARSVTQSREADARAERSEAEGETNAIRAEVTALAKLVERDTAEGGQIIDRLQVEKGFEKALGAALADDLRAPEVDVDGPTGWAVLPAYGQDQQLPDGVTALSQHVSVPDVLGRRMGQIGLVDADDGNRLQPLLKPGQRLVSTEGDVWRWDGFRAWAEDAPSSAALRLQQLNRLEELKQLLERATVRMGAAQKAHESLNDLLAEQSRTEREARDARRDADREVGEAARFMSRAEADRDMAQGRIETLKLAVERHEEEANVAIRQRNEAENALKSLGDLEAARDEIEDLRMTVEAARMTMMTKRSTFDEVRREGEARTRRSQEVTKELSGWRHRLETAEKRSAELFERKGQAEEELATAVAAPTEIAAQRDALGQAIEDAEKRRQAAADQLAIGETQVREAMNKERDLERAASEAREVRAAAEARTEAAREAVQASKDRIQEVLETTPEALLENLNTDAERMPPSDQVEAEVNRLKRQRDALGAVNLRAEE
ncbi:MAG: chromosome segregation SMC family protein, partial [Paracoccaceae bacterium]